MTDTKVIKEMSFNRLYSELMRILNKQRRKDQRPDDDGPAEFHRVDLMRFARY